MSELSIIMYHYVRDLARSRFPDMKGLDLNLFRVQIQFLKAHFAPVTMEDVVRAFHDKTPLPQRALLLTFDDGYSDHFTNVFPILREEKLQGSFFIPGKTFTEQKLLDVNKIHFTLASADIAILTAVLLQRIEDFRQAGVPLPTAKELFATYAHANRFDQKETIFFKRMLQTVLPKEIRKQVSSELFKKYVGAAEETFASELYLNQKQISEMKESGMHIGLHGYDHDWLGNLTRTELEADFSKAFDCMSDFIDRDCWTMCYPYSSYNQKVIRLLKSKGCRMAFTAEVRRADTRTDDPFMVPRYDTNDFPPISTRFSETEGRLT